MNRIVLYSAALMALLAVGGSAVLRGRIDNAEERTSASIGDLQRRVEAAERLVRQTAAQAGVPPVATQHAAATTTTTTTTTTSTTTAAEATQPDDTTTQSTPPPTDPPPSTTQVLTNSVRDVVVTVDRCTLVTRTLRCTFTALNQSPAEKKFILGVGGHNLNFEEHRGGTAVFDDVGNDFLSAGGGIGNHAEANCDRWDICEVNKTLTPAVRTAGWLRFDNVDARANVIKLLRLKWSDGNTWVPMDFRIIPIVRQGV